MQRDSPRCVHACVHAAACNDRREASFHPRDGISVRRVRSFSSVAKNFDTFLAGRWVAGIVSMARGMERERITRLRRVEISEPGMEGVGKGAGAPLPIRAVLRARSHRELGLGGHGKGTRNRGTGKFRHAIAIRPAGSE